MQLDRRLRLCMGEAGYTFIGRWFVPWIYWGVVRLFGRGHYGRKAVPKVGGEHVT